MKKTSTEKASAKKKPVIEEALPEIENVRISERVRESILDRVLREKFAAKIASAELAVTKELPKAHLELYPELKKLTEEERGKWLYTTGRFRIKTKKLPSGEFEFSSSNQLPQPRRDNGYRICIAKPHEELTKAVDALIDVAGERDKLKNNLRKVLMSVFTSRQLCDLIPECRGMFQKKVQNITGSPSVSLVPIELIRSVRASLQQVS
jgi:hypothetical protein